jgi:hypothetical protein
MELTVTIDNETLSIVIDNPFRLDSAAVERKIRDFISSKSLNPHEVDVGGLLPRMIRGVAGCEKGCPANALDLVQRGFKNFELSYIDGGILIARVLTGGKTIYFKVFPDF